ncbi:MAG TPA: 4-alpha-glucanotransferase [Opitutaceae bacterium]|nr:4-alpha-glucanotransferase [Opitutaceae bacterium]
MTTKRTISSGVKARAPAPAASGTWLDTRSAGVLAHVTSLPGRYGIGNLGPGARDFVDFLAEAGFRYWQICPIGPTGFGDSPYQLFSGSAGNPYLIDLAELEHDGLLERREVAVLDALPEDRVDYGRLYETFWSVLARAHDRFAAAGADEVNGLGSFAAFRERHARWLEPFADFMALKSHFGGYAWTLWPAEYRSWRRTLRAVMPAAARRDVDRHAFYQYVVFGQWQRLRRYAAERGVGIIGDVPIFVAFDSADTWQNRPVFRLDPSGQPLATAGVPPDYFSATGQLWGNPLYDWEHLARTGYAWWIDRLRAAFDLYDIIRLDHFRGFDTYWEVPAGAPDARGGRWRDGPGLPFLNAVRDALPHARIIAEDLGYTGPGVVALRRAAGLPGMKILQFAYGHDAHNVNLPHFYPPDSVAYTGTHDNITCRGWLEHLPAAYEDKIDAYFQLGGSRSAWPVIRALLATVSRLAVVPMQDLLDLPASATLNRPGTSEGNWQWRFTAAQLKTLRADKVATLRNWIELYDRTGDHTLREYSKPPENHDGSNHS